MLQEKLKGNNFVGSKCMVTVERQGKTFTVQLTRSPTRCAYLSTWIRADFVFMRVHTCVDRDMYMQELLEHVVIITYTRCGHACSDVRNMERILELLETHERMIRQGQIPNQMAEALLSSLQMLLGQIINNERRRLKQEERLAARLHNLQGSVFEQVG